jgi:hypothetical protein
MDNPDFRNESQFETSKSDSFADDNSTGTLLEYGSLFTLKNVLNDFAVFSGLKCNTEKTSLMPIGPRVQISNEILGLGFSVTDSIHILGMDIDRELEHLDANFEKTIVSLKKCVQYWKRYNLTLTGRINVIKSLLFSQILYLGCFIMPSCERMKKIQSILDEFALGTMNFAKNKIYLEKEEGGLGLFNVENFLTGQQSAWIFRANVSTRDNWRFKLRSLCNGDVLCAGTHLIKKEANPVLHGLAASFQNFKKKHDGLHSNFANAIVFNNPLFFRGPANKLPIDLSYLGLREGIFNPICSMLAKEFFNVNGLRTRLDLNLTYGLDISVEGYVALSRCLNHYVLRIRPNARNNGSSTSIREDYVGIKKPGKKIRSTMSKFRKKNFKIEDAQSTVTFLRASGLTFTDPVSYGIRISLWGTRGIPNRTKTFLFKYFNNILGINTRLSHFVANRRRGCTFCELNVPNAGRRGPDPDLVPDPAAPVPVPLPIPEPIPDESFEHLFYGCLTTREWQTKFLDVHFPANFTDSEASRKAYLLMGFHKDHKKNILVTMAPLLMQYCIWEARLKKKIPSFNSLNQDFIEICRKFVWTNSVAYNCGSFLNFPLRRNLGYGPVRERQPENEREGGHVPQQDHQGHAGQRHQRDAGAQPRRNAPRPPPAPDEP